MANSSHSLLKPALMQQHPFPRDLPLQRCLFRSLTERTGTIDDHVKRHSLHRKERTADLLDRLSGPHGVIRYDYAQVVIAVLVRRTIGVGAKEIDFLRIHGINGNNYVKLRDVGEAVGFNVYWDREKSCVQIESDKPYTGTAPTKSETAESVQQPAPQTDTDAMKMDIVERTNAIRTEKGAAALVVNDKLMQAAQVRADEMAASGIYSHTRPDGRQYYTVTDCPYTAENIHQIADWQIKDGELAAFAVREWAESPGHLKNMLNSRLSEIGVGLARGSNISGDPCWYCVQLFLYDGNTVHSVDAPATIK